MVIQANVVNILARTIEPADIYIEKGKIVNVLPQKKLFSQYILPAFVDAHVHIESSMLVPSEFARLAVRHGTVATVSDPHEIANVLGVKGVALMIENAQQVPFKFFFGVPSCVPATPFETAGATITAEDIDLLFAQYDLKYLAEMMNFPAVLRRDNLVMDKIRVAQKYGKVIDGHAPALRGETAKQYIAAGISTDHECVSAAEALDKLQYGMKILIREGSAAKNFNALIDLLPEHWENMMFCSDDKHPDDLVVGHINLLVKRAVARGIDVFKVLQAACINPVKHYGLEVGLLNVGDAADFILVDNLQDFNVLKTYINGELVAETQQDFIKTTPAIPLNYFEATPRQPKDFALAPTLPHQTKLRVIEAIDGELITKLYWHEVTANMLLNSDTKADVLKMTVINRYTAQADPAIAFIKNFGLKHGAIASSVGHDSHNIIAVGVNDEEICKAVNTLIAHKGGIVAVNGNTIKILPLPVAGIMSAESGETVAKQYTEIDQFAKSLGCTLKSPFMTLSFMALLVIPALKLSDKGLFDVNTFEFVELLG
jgi:adenine deaminase